ncbi:hypothetical protein FKM82_006565 [Ascaphus truei]
MLATLLKDLAVTSSSCTEARCQSVGSRGRERERQRRRRLPSHHLYMTSPCSQEAVPGTHRS